jgi:hypothetical protein
LMSRSTGTILLTWGWKLHPRNGGMTRWKLSCQAWIFYLLMMWEKNKPVFCLSQCYVAFLWCTAEHDSHWFPFRTTK